MVSRERGSLWARWPLPNYPQPLVFALDLPSVSVLSQQALSICFPTGFFISFFPNHSHAIFFFLNLYMIFHLGVLGTLLETCTLGTTSGSGSLLGAEVRGMTKATWTLSLMSSHSGGGDGPFQCHTLCSKAGTVLARKVTRATVISLKSW